MSADEIDEAAVEEQALDLAAAGLLTEQQARTYIYRDVEGLTRQQTADALGISISVVDDHTRAARSKVEAARKTVDVAAEIHGSDVALYLERPDETDE